MLKDALLIFPTSVNTEWLLSSATSFLDILTQCLDF